MGSSYSTTRTVTVDNPDPPGVIQISTDLADRISMTSRGNDGPEPRPEAPAPTLDASNMPSLPAPTSADAAKLPTLQRLSPDMSLTALQVRQQKEAEIKELEEQWRNRLKNQEDKFVAAGKITEENFKQAISDVERFFKKPHGPVCEDNQREVLKCFKDNVDKPLECAKLVQAFSRCVEVTRLIELHNESCQPQ